MNSKFLSMLGLGNIDIGYIFLGLLIINIVFLILLIMAFVQINNFKKKYEKFMLGKDGGSLENDIVALYEDNRYMKLNIDQNREDIKEINKKHESALQKVGLVKYDAFKEMGGKLSFALAILDEKNNGILLNSVHSSDGCYSYTKRINEGDSQIALSNEERVAVERAINGSETNIE